MGSFPATYNDPSYLDWILKQSVDSAECDLYMQISEGVIRLGRSITPSIERNLFIILFGLSNVLFDFWFSIGLLVYFCYGYSHSVEAVKPSERSETPFIRSTMPDFGTEFKEYPSPR